MKKIVDSVLPALLAAAALAPLSASADTHQLPASLQSGLSLWLDANANVFEGTFNGESGVIHWCDVREAFADGEAYADHASFSYPVASATTATPYGNLKGGLVPPMLVTDQAGLKYIDFGLYGNYGGGNNWMFTENGGGTLQKVTSRSLFAVVSFGKADNFGTVFGQIPALTSNSGATGSWFKRQPGGEGGAIANAGAVLQNGETRLDGGRVNPETTTYSFAGRQVFSQIGPGVLANGTAPVFNTFFNDRNQGTATQGGGRLSEVLVYDRVLSNAEREAVEDYLAAKWLGAPIDHAASGVTAPAEATPAGYATYTDDVRIGLDALEGEKTITVSGAKAILCAPATDGATDAPEATVLDTSANLVSHGSFESPAQAAGAFQAVVPTGWTKPSGNSYLAAIGSAIYNPSASLNATIPDGNQCVGIQGGNGTLQQTIDVPADGLYKVSFYMTRRPGRSEGANNTRGKVLVDGVMAYYGCVSTDSRGDQDLFKYYTVELPPLTKGSHTFALSLANNTSTDRAVLFDDVRVTPVAAGEFVHIPNSGFESAGPMTYTANVGYDAVANTFSTDIISWSCPVFYVDGKSCHARLAQNSQYFYWKYTGNQANDLAYSGEPPDERDYRKLVLVRAGCASQTVHVPRAGRLRFSMRYSRSYWGGTTGQRIGILLGGEEVARTPAVASVDTQTFVGDFDWPSAGDFSLMVTNILGSSTEIATVIDDLRLEYVDGVIFDSTRPDGLEPVALGDGESVSATLDVASNGCYYVALSAAGLAVEDDSAAGVYNSYKYYPAHAEVSVDGTAVATFTVESPDFAHVPVRLPYLAAGTHAIAITGVGDAVATLGKVRIEKATLLPLATESGPFDTKNALFHLVDGASLELDYPGTQRLGRVRSEGRSYFGILSGQTNPGFLCGAGSAEVIPGATLLIVR